MRSGLTMLLASLLVLGACAGEDTGEDQTTATTTLAPTTTTLAPTTTTLAPTTTPVPTTTLATQCATTMVGDPRLLNNGDFETGDLTGWTVDAHNAFGAWGTWFIYEDGNTSPSSGSRSYEYNVFEVPDPPQGRYAAATDGNGPGRFILYQDFAVEAPSTLSLVVFYLNRGSRFIAREHFEFSGGSNQQFRIDLVDPIAAVDSLASEDVLGTVFQTVRSDPLTLEPTEVTFDLTPWDGQTVRLRIAEITNAAALYVGVDSVCVEPAG